MTDSLRVEHLTHVYMPDSPFEKKSLDDVSLSVKQGEFLGIIGHTGSGKSTLIQHFNGLLKPVSGRVLVNGQDISDKNLLKQVRFTVGMVFQYPEYQLFEETVFADIAFGPRNRKLEEEEIKQRVYEAADAVGVAPELMEKSPFELSGGQKRRVAIAGVLAMKPQILVLDEPTAGLDPKSRESVLRRLKRLHETEGMTVIIVSHSMEDIARAADRLLVMDHGKVAMFDETAKVFARPADLEKIGLRVPQVTKIMTMLLVVEAIDAGELALDDVVSDLEEGTGPTDCGGWLVDVCDALTDHSSEFIEQLHDKIIDLEDNLLDQQIPPRGFLALLRKQLIVMRRYMAPQRDVYARLASERLPWMSDDQRRRMQDIADRLGRGLDEIDACIARTGVMADEIAQVMQENLARRTYTMSLMAMVFLPSTFLTGLFGVNLGGIPGGGWQFGFSIFCILLVVLIGGVALWLHRSKWL